MKALSVHPYFAMAIVSGQKYIECRTWNTDYRGDILICSTAKKYHDTIPSHALGVVTLKDVRPMKKTDISAALMLPEDYHENQFAWILDYNRLIVPIPIKGKLGLWDYDGEIEYIPEEEWLLPPEVSPEDAPAGKWFEKYWKPLMF